MKQRCTEVGSKLTKMVKVIGRDERVVKRCTCKSCASILEYTKCEAKLHKHYDYGGGCDTYYWIKCPACGYAINLGSYL
jgi:RNase P subunit RPR2